MGNFCEHMRGGYYVGDGWTYCAKDKTHSGWSAKETDCTSVETGCEEYEAI